MMHEVFSPPIPFSIPIINGMPHKAKIEIEGSTYQGPQQNFAIEFLAGSEIAMHLNFRFGFCGQHIIVLNSMHGGVWRNEEHHCNPLHIGQPFRIKIKSKDEKVKININDEKIHFHHRMSPHFINAIGIKGDVMIQRIHFDNFHEHCFQSIGYGAGYGVPGMPGMQHPPAYGPYGGMPPMNPQWRY